MELSIHGDKIISTIVALKSRERDRSSEAGEDREEIGNLIELTGLHKKALSFVRAIDKMEPDKRDDVLRSLHPLLELMDKHWNGQSTPDMFNPIEPHGEAPDEPAEPDDFDRQLSEAAE